MAEIVEADAGPLIALGRLDKLSLLGVVFDGTIVPQAVYEGTQAPRTRTALAAAGHDAIWTGDWTPDPGDEAILEFAQRESRILITLDKDFGELAVVFGSRIAESSGSSISIRRARRRSARMSLPGMAPSWPPGQS
ncbi:MAG: DUF5615 family PIN-like protein [Burkholderiales bacterium]|nr:DUF5615 family PIN-like protein [Burkholderiales bacterium]